MARATALGIAVEKLVRAIKTRNPEAERKCLEVMAVAAERLGDAESAQKIRAISTAIASLSPMEVWRPADPPVASTQATSMAASELVLPKATAERIETIVEDLRIASKFLAAKLDAPTRILFVGPPGVGKTLAARSIAERLGLPLLVADLEQVIEQYMGQTGKNIGKLFEEAQKAPTVLMLDEVDALASNRGEAPKDDIGEAKRVTATLIGRLDGAPVEQIIIAATNVPHVVDPAILRRFPTQVTFELPVEEMRRAMVQKWLSALSLEQREVDELIERSKGFSGAMLRAEAMALGRAHIRRKWIEQETRSEST